MAFTFFPTTVSEIKTTLKTSNTTIVDEIITIFQYISSTYPKVQTPINIDISKPSVININRALQGDLDLVKLKRFTKSNKVKYKFGDGSSGGRGVQNRGNAFESIFANDLISWWNNDVSKIDVKTKTAIEDISNTYNLKKSKTLVVNTVGELNNPRPLIFTPSVLISSKIPISNNNLGPVVTDITLTTDFGDVYLSLKMGPTVTFFNVGIKKVLTTPEIKTGNISNKDGLKILNMFNIKPEIFCDIFNGKLENGYSDNVWPNMKSSQKSNLTKFLSSGIGHGYHVVHKFTNKIKSVQVDENYMKLASTPTSCTIYYGGKTGTGKRIDMEIVTKKYVLKLNIRDTQGGDGYPTRMMCDFTQI